MVNKQLLKAKIMIGDGNQLTLARAMGIPLDALSRRINGHMEFKLSEVDFIRKRYSLSDADVIEIFFA